MNNREYNNKSNFPIFCKNSCPGNGEDVVNESMEFLAKSKGCCAPARPNVSGNIETSPQDFKEVGISSCSCTKSLQYMPAFDGVKLDEHLIANQQKLANIVKYEKRTDEFDNLLDKLGSNIADDIDLSVINDAYLEDKSRQTVVVATTESLAICKETLKQAKSSIWHIERSKRITASLFGRVCN